MRAVCELYPRWRTAIMLHANIGNLFSTVCCTNHTTNCPSNLNTHSSSIHQHYVPLLPMMSCSRCWITPQIPVHWRSDYHTVYTQWLVVHESTFHNLSLWSPGFYINITRFTLCISSKVARVQYHVSTPFHLIPKGLQGSIPIIPIHSSSGFYSYDRCPRSLWHQKLCLVSAASPTFCGLHFSAHNRCTQRRAILRCDTFSSSQ